MNRISLCLMTVLAALSLSSCNGLVAVDKKDISGTPSVYATVTKEPNPKLVGCYIRSRPGEYNRPNKYEFCLVKSAGGYGLYYYAMDGKSLRSFKDWSPATINGDCLTAEYDASTYCVKDGEVWQTTVGGGGPHRMLPMH
jgi:predicted small secreted protein